MKITAACTSEKQIDVKVDQWKVSVAHGGSIDWILDPGGNPTTDPVVTIEPKNANPSEANWPFDDFVPFRAEKGGGKNKKVRENAAGPNNQGKNYQYSVRIVCGTSPNDRTVVIDPDIFVD